MPGMILKQKRIVPGTIDTFKIQLVPLRAAPKARISSPQDVQKLVKEMEDYDRESAKIIHLDTKNQVIGIETISIGSLSASIVHPRETVKGAILNNSANVIFVHNHPSGICGPSNEDIAITRKLEQAFELVGIRMLDSVIIGKGCYYSLKELGYLGTKTETTGMVSEPRAISKPAAGMIVRESTGAGRPCERIKEIKAELERLNKELSEAYKTRDIPRANRLYQTGTKLRAEWNSLVGECQKKQWEQMKGAATVREPAIVWKATGYEAKETWEKSPLTENELVKQQEALGWKWFEHAGTLYQAKEEAKYWRRSFPNHEVKFIQDKTGAFQLFYKEKPVSGRIPQYPTRTKFAFQGSPYTVSENIRKKYIVDGKEVSEQEFKAEWSNTVSLEELKSFTSMYKLQLSEYYPFPTKKGIYNVKGKTFIISKYEEIPQERTDITPSVNNIEVFLNRLTVDTSRYSRAFPIPQSAIIGAAIPEDGYLFAYHITDTPEDTIRKLRSNIPLCQLNPEGDLGCGFYASGVPQYWTGRSRAKWDFARNLTRAQRQKLVDVILSDPRYKKGGGYLADFEVDYLNRDLRQFVETGDVSLLAMTGNQPYNVQVTEEIARKAGVPSPKVPRMVKVKLQGKFINAEELYHKPEILNRAQAWAVVNRPKLLEWNKRASNQDIVNAWLCSMRYRGAFTKSGFSTNPEMVIWDRRAIIDAWIPKPQE